MEEEDFELAEASEADNDRARKYACMLSLMIKLGYINHAEHLLFPVSLFIHSQSNNTKIPLQPTFGHEHCSNCPNDKNCTHGSEIIVRK